MKDGQRQTYLAGLIPYVKLIEDLAPAIANRLGTGINAEYPWMLPVEPPQVVAPVEYAFTAIPTSKLPKILQLIRVLLQSCS